MLKLIKLCFITCISNFFAFLYMFKSLDNRTIIFNSVENKSYNFNSRYLFEYILNNYKDKFNVKFVINNMSLREELNKSIGEYFISSESINNILIILKAKYWITSSITSPIEFLLFKNNKRIVFHLGHGIPLKNIVFAEENISIKQWINRYLRVRIFTHVLCYSEKFKPIMENIFRNKNIQHVPLGQPRNDSLIFKNKESIKNYINDKLSIHIDYDNTILYSPTWRPYCNTKFFPFDDLSPEELNKKLVENKTLLFLRKHPYFPCEINEEFLSQSNIKWFNSDEFPDIDDYFIFFDKLLTDYSSIFLDYLSVNKSIGFIPYDIDVYKKHVGFTGDELFCGPMLYNVEDFYNFLFSTKDSFIKNRQNIIELIGTKNKNNCKELFDYIFK